LLTGDPPIDLAFDCDLRCLIVWKIHPDAAPRPTTSANLPNNFDGPEGKWTVSAGLGARCHRAALQQTPQTPSHSESPETESQGKFLGRASADQIRRDALGDLRDAIEAAPRDHM